MKTIHLHRLSTEWVATITGPEAEAVHDLFGTTTLPTAFAASVDPETVLAAVRHRNPGTSVRLITEAPHNGQGV
jgi:hypothetical protein